MKNIITLGSMLLLLNGCNQPKQLDTENRVERDYLEEYYKAEEDRYEAYLSKLGG